jgi:hypothetical protein
LHAVINQTIPITCCKLYARGANPAPTWKESDGAALTAENSNYNELLTGVNKQEEGGFPNGMTFILIFIRFRRRVETIQLGYR